MQVRSRRRTARAAVRGSVAAVVLAALVAGCTTGTGDPVATPGTPSAPSSASPTGPAEDVTLTMSVFGRKASLEAYDELARAFTKNNPRVTVRVEHAPDAATALADLRRATREGHPPDVLLAGQEYLPTLVRDRLVQPVDALLEQRDVDFGDGYQRAGLEAFAESARLQCMPNDVSPTVVYYNPDLVRLRTLVEPDEDPITREEGWTWEQFVLAARRASRGKAKGVYVPPELQSLIPLVWSAGGDIVDDPEQPSTLTLSEGAAGSALGEVLPLFRDPHVTPTKEELARQDEVSRFKQGRLGMLVGDRSLTPRLRRATKVDFDVMPLPSLGRIRTIASMTGYCLSSRTEHVEEAADLLAFAVGREGATIAATPGYIVPANLDVANSPAFLQPTLPPQHASVFNDAVRRTETAPPVPEWPRVVESVSSQVERLFYSPMIDLETRLTEIDSESRRTFTPAEE